MKELTLTEKIYGLSKLWKESSYNFTYFNKLPNLNWDETYKHYLDLVINSKSNLEYYIILKKFFVLLNDGHTTVALPKELSDRVSAPSLCLGNIGNRIYVVDSFLELSNTISVGSEIILVNNMSLDDYLNCEVYPLIQSSTPHYRELIGAKKLLFTYDESPISINFKTPEGEELSHTLETHFISPVELNRIVGVSMNSVSFSLLPKGIAYVKINHFMDSSIGEKYKNFMDSISECNGIIFDLRNNAGGNSDYAMNVIAHFAEEDFQESLWKTPRHTAAFKSWGMEKDKFYSEEALTHSPLPCKRFPVPKVLLTSNFTFSSGEDFTLVFKYHSLGKIIGQVTGGSSGNPLKVDLPGGGYGLVCTLMDLFPDGAEYVGSGISPDILVPLTLEELLSVRDVTLERALEYINLVNR